MDPNDFLASEGMLSPDNNEENLSPLLKSPLFDFAVPKQSPTGRRKAQASFGMPILQDNIPQNTDAFRNLEMNHYPPLIKIELCHQKENTSRHHKRFATSRGDAMETMKKRLDFFHRVALEAQAENTRLRQRIHNLEKRFREQNGGFDDGSSNFHDDPQYPLPAAAPSILLQSDDRMEENRKPSLLERRRMKSSLAISVIHDNEIMVVGSDDKFNLNLYSSAVSIRLGWILALLSAPRCTSRLKRSAPGSSYRGPRFG
eukprot:scaffold437_cov159-Amphora_coffeaeformis.AAC.16